MDDDEYFTAQQFMGLGLETAGYPRWESYKEGPNIERFRKAYGVVPATCESIWTDLLETDNDMYRLTIKEAKQPIKLLWVLRWLWKYDTEEDVASFFRCCAKTFSLHSKLFMLKLQAMMHEKIGDLGDYQNERRIILFSIDGTHCPIEEPRPFDSKWGSHKFGMNPGVNYELLVDILRPKIAWVYGPFPPGKYNDISVFRRKLLQEMEDKLDGKKIIGDQGYRGEPHFIMTRNEFDPDDINEFKDRVLARHETFNQSIKLWEAMKIPWRHGVENHKAAFESIVYINQIQIDNGTCTAFDPYLE